uniref:Uncharacterized protein n=1 Tax=Palpitomonas bilix TaxID=652834 RepID=A0A7S3LVK3_9EUKA
MPNLLKLPLSVHKRVFADAFREYADTFKQQSEEKKGEDAGKAMPKLEGNVFTSAEKREEARDAMNMIGKEMKDLNAKEKMEMMKDYLGEYMKAFRLSVRTFGEGFREEVEKIDTDIKEEVEARMKKKREEEEEKEEGKRGKKEEEGKREVKEGEN